MVRDGMPEIEIISKSPDGVITFRWVAFPWELRGRVLPEGFASPSEGDIVAPRVNGWGLASKSYPEIRVFDGSSADIFFAPGDRTDNDMRELEWKEGEELLFDLMAAWRALAARIMLGEKRHG